MKLIRYLSRPALKKTHYRLLGVVIVFVFLVYGIYKRGLYTRHVSYVEKLPLFRDDLNSEQEWPAVLGSDIVSSKAGVPQTVHYVWCGEKQFRFHHYLGVLSAVRILRPLKFVFHYTHLPVVDEEWYNTWFEELKQSLPGMELRYMRNHGCGSVLLLKSTISRLSASGGFYIGENVILTRFPTEVLSYPIWFAVSKASDDLTQGLIYIRGGVGPFNEAEYYRAMRDSRESGCISVEVFNRAENETKAPCFVVTRHVLPRDIWATSSRFAEMARWLFYGKREMLQVKPSPSPLIPRVGHLVFLTWNGEDMELYQYLSVMSALYIAGLHHVYIHGDAAPTGQWWEKLSKENVTYLPVDAPYSIFQQKVSSMAHKGDYLRLTILNKHGGVYNDRDVIWVNRLPDEHFHYPTVMCPDWPYRGEWPETINTGVVMSQRNSPWLNYYLPTLRYFIDHHHLFNSVSMSYRTYERHPDTLYLDRHLQVLSYHGIYHPVWQPDYKRNIHSKAEPTPFDWRLSKAYHFSSPKPPKSLASLQAIKTGTDMAAEIGRFVVKTIGEDKVRTTTSTSST